MVDVFVCRFDIGFKTDFNLDHVGSNEVEILSKFLQLLSERIQAIVESYSYCCVSLIMPAPEVHHLFHHPIADHSFSADRQTLAAARDNNVELYGKSGSKFGLQDELKGHDKTVTGVDIAPETGRIVTCSQGEML